MGVKSQEDLDLLAEAGAEARARFAPSKGRSKVRFGAKAAGFVRRDYDDLIKKPAPGPQGPSMAQLQEEAARRRREQRAKDRGQ